ncbi:ABC transporter permease [Bacillus shivajii]|uniref:ABC transporter permease n=1 Tax=Bacillus shivajii TaxID=1983719 RepID=UPI001CFA6CD7|nr:ABC transporter permease [Bacillus shivajii]UCZ53615.1 ABC transporter permease [Bacillus shivajii]
MRNSLKVARWEIKRNLKNKSFLISLFLTPLIFMFFFSVPVLFSGGGPEQPAQIQLYISDELAIENEVDQLTSQESMRLDFAGTIEDEESFIQELEQRSNTIYVPLTEDEIIQSLLTVYKTSDVSENDLMHLSVLEPVLKQYQLASIGLSQEEIRVVVQPIDYDTVEVEGEEGTVEQETSGTELLAQDPAERLIPGAFAGLILFSVVITGMMIFQSASQEKKEKVAEMVLSSLTPTELMQGKIVGYFALGLIQVLVWFAMVFPIILWRFSEIPILQYLFVPELVVLIVIAIAGYLLFASLFVGIGATVEDISASSNFQGIIFMLPWLPFILIGPILSDPNGLIAQIGTYFPLTSPGVLLIRLSILQEWVWLEIIFALVILFLSIWLLMKLAGKVFKTGILMYGKNATPKEIWKWIRQ